MTVASRAVVMAVMTEARTTDVELRRHTSHWVVIVVTSGVVGVEQTEPSLSGDDAGWRWSSHSYTI